MRARKNVKVEMPITNLKRVVDSLSNMDHPVFRQYNEIIIGGMGGSGIVGSIVADFFSSISSKPIIQLRLQSLPAWAERNTLVIVVSYSGNTSEMISLYNDAKKRGCGIVVVTSGGNLEKMAKTDGMDLILIGGGFMPRSDITTPISHVLAIIDSQIGTHVHKEYMETLKKGIDYAATLESDDMNEARRIALDISAKMPFFYTAEQARCISSRWRAQLNENAKVVAADGAFPEFDHNEIEGWCGEKRKEVLPVILRTSADGETRRYMDACCKVLSKRGMKPYIIDIKGETLMETIVFGIVLGDYVSLYLAEYLGVDPSPVDAITEFKNLLKK